MDDLVRIFKSPDGDVYHITLSEDKGVLSSDALDALKDITVVGIELRRLAGNHATGHDVLIAIEDTIAELFFQRDDVIICYVTIATLSIQFPTRRRIPYLLRNIGACFSTECSSDTQSRRISKVFVYLLLR